MASPQPRLDTHVLWILLGPHAPLDAEQAAAILRRECAGAEPDGHEPPTADGAASDPPAATRLFEARGVRTVEHVRSDVAQSAAETLERALAAALPTHRDLHLVSLHHVSAEPAETRPAHVAMGALELSDLGAGGLGERWRLGGALQDHPSETFRRLHRLAAALFLLTRHTGRVRGYAEEIASELEHVQPAVDRALRFRAEGVARPELIDRFEQTVKELSSNYARLSRNAGVFREVIEEQERLVGFLRESIEGLPGSAAASGSDPVFAPRLDEARDDLARLRQQRDHLLECLQSAQTAITTLGLHIELLRSGELLALQQHTGELLHRGVSLQAAAVLIEFVVLFAYTLHSWELLLGEHTFQAVPRWIRFLAPLTFSGGVIFTAHSFADYLKERHFPRWAWLTLTLVVLALGTMAAAPHVFPAGH